MATQDATELRPLTPIVLERLGLLADIWYLHRLGTKFDLGSRENQLIEIIKEYQHGILPNDLVEFAIRCHAEYSNCDYR